MNYFEKMKYGFRKKYQRNKINEELISRNNPTKLVEFKTMQEEKEKNVKNKFQHMSRNLSNINNSKNKKDENNKIKTINNLKEEPIPPHNHYKNYKIDKMRISYKVRTFIENNSEEKNENNLKIFTYDSKKGIIVNEFEENNKGKNNDKLKYEYNNVNKYLKENNEINNNLQNFDINENNKFKKIKDDKFEAPYNKKYFKKCKEDNIINGGDNWFKNKSVNKTNKISQNIKKINKEMSDDEGINNKKSNELFDRLKYELNKIERINAEKKLKGNMLQLVKDVVKTNFYFKENIFFRNLDNTSQKIGNMDNIHKRSISHTFKEIDTYEMLK